MRAWFGRLRSWAIYWWYERPGLARGILLTLGVVALLYYPLGAVLVHRIDDDLAWRPANAGEGGSIAVATAAGLIRREIDEHGWPGNDPFFKPAWILDNMPNYQLGIIESLRRFAFEMTDQLGRARGSSAADVDLQQASGLLQYPADVWIVAFEPYPLPKAPTESQYREAARALERYNARLAQGTAAFDVRADNLLSAVDRFALDLGSLSAALDKHVTEHAGDLIDTEADDVFYRAKGQVYAYAVLLRALRQDFAAVIDQRTVANQWDEMLLSLEAAASVSPWVVVNGSPSAEFRPNHLLNLGFHLLRARTQMREISNILQN